MLRALSRNGARYLSSSRRGAITGVILGVGGATLAMRAKAEENVSERQPHALYVWGGNDGCTVPQSGVALGQQPQFGVAEAGGARGVAATRVPVVSRPRAVPFFDDRGIKSIAFADTHAAAVDQAGKLCVWGAAHAERQPCCDDSRERASQPCEVACKAAAGLVQVTCSAKCVYLLNLEGQVLSLRATAGAAAKDDGVTLLPWAGAGAAEKIVKICAQASQASLRLCCCLMKLT